MKKSFLIPAIVLYVVRVAFSNNVQVGTVLFTTTDLVRKCWSDYDKSLLRARAIMQDVLPDPDCLDFSNPESIVILLDYFHTCYKIINISTYGKVQHLLFMALSDAFGGYLRAHVLPYTRKFYYAGVVKYSEAQKLFLLYDDIKSFLKTDGRGWPLPTKTPLRSFKVKPLVIKKGTEEACNLLFIIEKDVKRRHMGRKGRKSSEANVVELSKLKRRVQRQINDYNGTVLSSHNYLKNLSPQAEDINENEDITSFRCLKKNRKPPPLNLRGGISLGRKGTGNKEEGRKKELRKEELRKIQDYRAQARKEQARREEACREEASREEGRKEAARKHENLKEEPLTEDPCGESLCKTEDHTVEDHKEGFSIEDLFKDETPNEDSAREEQTEDSGMEDVLTEEEQKEDPWGVQVGKEEEQKEAPSREQAPKKKGQKEDHRTKQTTKEELLKLISGRQYPRTEKESKNQQHLKANVLKLYSLKKLINNNLQEIPPKEYSSTEIPPKEYSSTETPTKEYILKEVPCKEFILQEEPLKEHSSTTKSNKEYKVEKDPLKEHSTTEIPSKEYILQEEPPKEYFSTTLNKEHKLPTDPLKEHSTTEIPSKEYILQEEPPKEYFSTTLNKEHKLPTDPRKEHSTTEIPSKEYILQEEPPKEYFSTTLNKEHKLPTDPRKEHSTTEIPRKEFTLEENLCKEFSSTATPNKEYKVEKDHRKEQSTTEILRKEFILQEEPLKEHYSTTKPNKEYKVEKEPLKEHSTTEIPHKEFILQENFPKEYSSTTPRVENELPKDPHKEHSTTEITRKEFILQETVYKEYSSTTPRVENELLKDTRKEHSTTEITHKEYILQENIYREYSPTTPSAENELPKDTRKEHSTTEITRKEYILQENIYREYSPTTPSAENELPKDTRKEHSSTESPYKEFVFQEEPNTNYGNKAEAPSTENPCKEFTFEKVFSNEDPCREVLKGDGQTGECQTEGVPEEPREEEVLSKNTVEEFPSRDEGKEETDKQKSRKRKGRKRKHRKHKSHKKKQRKQYIPKIKGQESGSKKTVMVPLPILDDYDCPTSIALPFRQRPLRNLKAASSAFILVNYYITVIKCFIAKGSRKRDIKDFNGQFQRWLTSKVLPLLGDEQWYPGFGGVLRVLETIKVFGADKTDRYKAEECENSGFLFDEGVEFSVDSSFGSKETHKTHKHRGMLEVVKGTDPLRQYMYVFILIFSAVVFFLLCGCFCFCRRGPSPEEEQDMNQQENHQVDPNYAHQNPNVDRKAYQEGKKDPYAHQTNSTYDKPQTHQGGEVWSYGDARGMQHHQHHEAHFLTKETEFPTEPRLLHNVHTLWKKPSNQMNRYWTSDETKYYKTEMRTLTCNCTESCHCTVVTDSSAVTKAKTRKSSTVTFFEADDDVAHQRRNTSTRSSTQYSTTESGSEDFSSSEYSESSKSLRKHRNSTHYP